ncbi:MULTISPECIES: DUF6776 family protein [Corallincola]|uniref:Uncharacterized protein n=2 Tax=Corallincola TaxID=1775176 RepID=A0A368NM38_9GAMM|nr:MULTISPECIES: DUF6776 family protein [Corallincola]RCU51617.1 hypothetical protein DU002_03870 [Corallincola holothuriorum]TAA47118.1 hypothetical protein EXY25_07700 [Corallincola spongiicola]
MNDNDNLNRFRNGTISFLQWVRDHRKPLLGVWCALMVGLMIGEFGKTSLFNQLNGWQTQADQGATTQVRLESQIEGLTAELQVEQAANAAMQQEMVAHLNEIYEQRRELTFYRKIMAPEKEASGVVIDEFGISATASAGFFRFRLVLMQLKRSKQFAKGAIELRIEGSQTGEPATLNLAELAGLTDKQQKFSFRYFQEIEGAFTLPEGFVPERVEIRASLPKRGSRKASSTAKMYTWQQLLDNT